tara:strand:+ start:2181 stop:2495 length:315 start_codon:yes stop_codon:yes gene_type:complete
LKKNKVFFILLLFSLAFLACGSETVSESVEPLTGEEIYTARCSACHGPNLEGRVGPGLHKESSAAKMPDSYWIQTITMGKGSMPAIRLNENEVQLVIEYIKSRY